MKCDLCEKSLHFGYTVSHSKRHSKRQWNPNIHSARVSLNGQVKRLNLCTRCLRTHHKVARIV